MTVQSALAIVSHPFTTTSEGKKETNWKLEPVTLPAPGPNEIVVEMIATGICHTDIALSLYPIPGETTPKSAVLGHEGSGYIRALGEGVTSHNIGDKVLLSFKYCKACEQCEEGHPAFCENFLPNLQGTDGYFTSSSGEAIKGQIFGQSSFASFSVVAESSAVNVTQLLNDEELKLCAPLGCGIQTGSGAIINIAKAGPKDRVVIMGLGGVGMSAIMAAKYMGCKTIIGIDRLQSRIDLALELGATHGINTSKMDAEKEVMEITSKKGATIVADTTGFEPLFDAAMRFLSRRGKMIIIGMCFGNYKFHADRLMTSGQRIIGCVEGDSIPSEYIPRMIQMYREGHLPFDRLVKEYPAADFQKALHAMEDGSVIKPILTWK